ncbi:hypothetical protein [Pacificispira sp.]|uniref:hypothetical protein n=1 Tax=Pacificispira sp. TaxID=2888761 RepID=UPI003BABF684
MNPDDIRQARHALCLSVAQMATLLETDPQTVRRMEMSSDRATARAPAARMVRLLRAYLDGWRPADWPE